MFSKLFCFLGLLAVAVAAYGPEYGKVYSSAYVNKKDEYPEIGYKNDHYKNYGHEYKYIDYYAYPKYEFEYKVEDYHTGDIKKQREYRNGDLVKGLYELHQPDGHERKVEYYSDDKRGFNADVKYNINHHIPKYEYHH